jgi:hypothetical protein
VRVFVCNRVCGVFVCVRARVLSCHCISACTYASTYIVQSPPMTHRLTSGMRVLEERNGVVPPENDHRLFSEFRELHSFSSISFSLPLLSFHIIYFHFSNKILLLNILTLLLSIMFFNFFKFFLFFIIFYFSAFAASLLFLRIIIVSLC